MTPRHVLTYRLRVRHRRCLKNKSPELKSNKAIANYAPLVPLVVAVATLARGSERTFNAFTYDNPPAAVVNQDPRFLGLCRRQPTQKKRKEKRGDEKTKRQKKKKKTTKTKRRRPTNNKTNIQKRERFLRARGVDESGAPRAGTSRYIGGNSCSRRLLYYINGHMSADKRDPIPVARTGKKD